MPATERSQRVFVHAAVKRGARREAVLPGLPGVAVSRRLAIAAYGRREEHVGGFGTTLSILPFAGVERVPLGADLPLVAVARRLAVKAWWRRVLENGWRARSPSPSVSNPGGRSGVDADAVFAGQRSVADVTALCVRSTQR